MNRAAIVAAIAALPLTAGTIDVSERTYALVHHGAGITVEFGVWNYGVNNPGYSPYPTSINFDLIVQQPAGTATAVPDSSASYYHDYLFGAHLVSKDGLYSIPLIDPFAALLGLPAGHLALAPGTFASGSAPETGVGVLSGSVNLSPELAAALFGDDFAARIVLRNLGPEVTLGIGPGYAIRNSVSEPGLSGDGPRSVGGLTGSVTVVNPEPGTWMLAAGAAAALLISNLRSSAARAGKRGRSRT